MQDFKVITTKYPTYLETLLQKNESIRLVFRQPTNSHVDEISNGTLHHDDTSEPDLELTGTPLQIDLGGDDTLCDLIEEQPQSWTSDENQHCPITFSEARMFINSQFREKKSPNEKSIFCICDGSDQQHIVILGSSASQNKFMRTLVYILPCCDEAEEVTTLEFMKKDHSKTHSKNAKIKTESRQCYNIYGFNLKNYSSLQNAENSGSITIEVTENQSLKNSIIKMNLQIILGHNSSSRRWLWDEMCTLQSYIKILASSQQLNEFDIIASEKYLDFSEICSTIRDLLNSFSYVKEREHDTIDLNKLRQGNILDKLWDILKHCRTLSDLRDSFHFFFEELVENQRNQIFDEDMSTVAEIVTGLLNGKLAVPTLTFTQSLELLVDLGLEKLEKDYLVIVTSFTTFGKEVILTNWRELCQNIVDLQSGAKRKTRLTLSAKSAFVELSKIYLKLSYLTSVHTAIEFMFLYKKNVPLSEENFDCFCDSVTRKFLQNKPNVGPVYDLKKPKLCEFVSNPFVADTNQLLKDKVPENWSVKMNSKQDNSEVTTVYYFSKYPIFPPSIYGNYDVDLENTNIHSLYVTKLSEYIQHCQ